MKPFQLVYETHVTRARAKVLFAEMRRAVAIRNSAVAARAVREPMKP